MAVRPCCPPQASWLAQTLTYPHGWTPQGYMTLWLTSATTWATVAETVSMWKWLPQLILLRTSACPR